MAVQEIDDRTTCTLPRRTLSSFSEGGLLNPSLDSNSGGGGMWWHLAPMPALYPWAWRRHSMGRQGVAN